MEGTRRFLMGCMGILVLGLAAMFAIPRMSPTRVVPPMGEMERAPSLEVLPPASPTAKPPLSQLDSLGYQQKYEEQLALCRKFLTQTEQPEAVAAAQQRLPDCLTSVFQLKMKAHDVAGARALLTEAGTLLAATPRDKSEVRSRLRERCNSMQREWTEAQRRRASDALKALDVARIDAVCQEIWDDPMGELPLDEYATFLMSRWNSERTAGHVEQADRLLHRAAECAAGDTHSLSYWGYRNGPVEQELRKVYPLSKLEDEGRKSLDRGDFLLAACWTSAETGQHQLQPPPDASYDVYVQRRNRVMSAFLGLCRQAEAGRVRWLRPDVKTNAVEVVLSCIIDFARDQKRLKTGPQEPRQKFRLSEAAWDTLYAVLRAKVQRLKEADDDLAVVALCDNTLTSRAEERLQFQRDILGEDVWHDVPATLRQALDKETPDQRWIKLMEAIHSRSYTPAFPGRDDFFAAEAEAQGRLGMACLDASQWAPAYQYFRPLFRYAPDGPAAMQARKALLNSIRKARESKDFSTIYSMAGFFMGEAAIGGVPPDLKEELAACLLAAANYFEGKSPMQRVFMLSLLADVLGDDPRGQKAREDALSLGFAAVEALPVESPRKPDRVLASPLPGLSVVGIENATEYHLMVFYQGPERFFVRFNPYRRGSVVVRDGAYTQAVIVTSDQVRPYRGQSQYQSQYAQHRYHIVTEVNGKKNDRKDLTEAWGEYALLRVPTGTGPFEIDGNSGLVRPK